MCCVVDPGTVLAMPHSKRSRTSFVAAADKRLADSERNNEPVSLVDAVNAEYNLYHGKTYTELGLKALQFSAMYVEEDVASTFKTKAENLIQVVKFYANSIEAVNFSVTADGLRLLVAALRKHTAECDAALQQFKTAMRVMQSLYPDVAAGSARVSVKEFLDKGPAPIETLVSTNLGPAPQPQIAQPGGDGAAMQQ